MSHWNSTTTQQLGLKAYKFISCFQESITVMHNQKLIKMVVLSLQFSCCLKAMKSLLGLDFFLGILGNKDGPSIKQNFYNGNDYNNSKNDWCSCFHNIIDITIDSM